MDVTCKCGASFHIDAEFAYYVKCPDCGLILSCSGHIELIPLTAEEMDAVKDNLTIAEAIGEY
jgi:hypothetical protein